MNQESKTTKNNLILLELNEVNFEAVKHYIKKGKNLIGFKKVFEEGIISTRSEIEYKNLEPWIQWPSVHTGKTYKEHNIFRLGDFVNSSHEQFFEKIEKQGLTVGAISPMNAVNNLKNPAYFIPDPWTKTPCDNSFFSKAITKAITQAVNDNSQSKLTYKTVFYLGLSFIFLVKPSRYFAIIRYALKAIRRPWRKALFLDILLFEIHKTLFKRKKPNFSTLFLNAGAHIQHHYFFNSSFVNLPELKNPSWYINENYDPLYEMLEVYDEMLTDLLNIKNTEIIIATGLSQKPFSELKFYYRLKDHASFLKKIGIEFTSVTPRMTRDFLISFESESKALLAESQLSKILVNKKIKMFEEIDNRGKDIFVVLTYPFEITHKTYICYEDKNILLYDLIVFVAIKNGEHQGNGYAYFSNGIKNYAPLSNHHVSRIHDTVIEYFHSNL